MREAKISDLKDSFVWTWRMYDYWADTQGRVGKFGRVVWHLLLLMLIISFVGLFVSVCMAIL